MHDMRALREQVDLLRDGMRRRGADAALLELIDRGCPPELAARILAPLGDEDENEASL